MHHLVRRTAAATVATFALAATAACGSESDDTGTRPGPDVSGAAGGGSATASGAGSSTGVLTKDSFVAALTAAVEEHKSAHITMSLAGTMSATGDVGYAGGSPAMQLAMTMPGSGGQKMNLRLVDRTMYLQVPGLTPAGKFLAVGKDDRTFGSMIGKIQSFSPGGALTLMGKGVKGFTHVGSTTIDGTSFAHYRVTVDRSALDDDFGVPSGATRGPKVVTEDVYVDGQNLLRRVTMKVDGHLMRLDTTGWGKRVRVAAPAAVDVVEPRQGLAAAPGTGGA